MIRSIPIKQLTGYHNSLTFLSKRTLKTSSSLQYARFINNSTRITKEISPDELRRLQQAQEQAKARAFQYEQSHSYPPPPQPSYSFTLPENKNGIITPNDPIYDILKEPTLVIERQIEFMNLFLGFEQANRYIIMNATGEVIGSMQEKDVGLAKIIGRQFFRLHRPFDIDVFDKYGQLALTIKRPFSFINSHIKAYLPGYDEFDDLMFECVGESVQSWHLWRRRYNLFKLEDEQLDEYEQFGMVDSPFLSFDFPIRNAEGKIMASVDRNWVGLGRELFTDTGVYILRFDPASFEGVSTHYGEEVSSQGVTLDQRAIILSCFTSIDFDYFSRHSRTSGGMFSFGSYE
ncbi:uncharacterized protein J8A68_003421 [[Candida] subhashii]|uniref:Phospholipid scramblase n=1 Tax=[Candida] subhashii TaxID=561895 RepID=A0A8J5QJB0_9ASCO|nr:uncharacterized protein J8A68_003421 [[Candida] subhashii]KAG7663039.1 hypothetical protein J8A68_003421 [[Candida] subhashii]